MEIVNFLAQFWGFSLIIIPLAFLVYPKYIEYIVAAVETEKNILACGIINLMAGIVLVLLYNVWDTSWKTIITIIAWITLARGIVCLFLPDIVKKMAEKVKMHTDWLSVAFVGFVILGCVLIYSGFAL